MLSSCDNEPSIVPNKQNNKCFQPHQPRSSIYPKLQPELSALTSLLFLFPHINEDKQGRQAVPQAKPRSPSAKHTYV